MNTVIINTETGKIEAVFSGPKSLHGKYINSMPEDRVAIEYKDSNLSSKKGELIDDKWQLVDDVEKLIESARKRKLDAVFSQKRSNLDKGITVTGEVFDGSQWVESQIKINFFGDDRTEIERAIRKFTIIGQAPQAMRSQRLLNGRSSFQIFIGKNERLSFASFTELQEFVDNYQKRQDIADAIEADTRQLIIEAQTIEEIDSIDETSGWEEING